MSNIIPWATGVGGVEQIWFSAIYGGYMYVTSGTKIVQIDASGTIITDNWAPSYIQDGPIGIAIDATGTYMYISQWGGTSGNGQIDRITMADNTEITLAWASPTHPHGITISGNYLYSASWSGWISRMNTSSAALEDQWFLPTSGVPCYTGITADSSETYIYVSNNAGRGGSNQTVTKISIANPSTNEIIFITSGANLWGINVVGNYVYIADNGNNRIIQLLLTDYTITNWQTDGSISKPIGLSSDGTYIYCCNRLSGTIDAFILTFTPEPTPTPDPPPLAIYGTFVAVGQSSDASNTIGYSLDGSGNDWSVASSDLFIGGVGFTGGRGIAYGYNLDGSGIFVAVGLNNNGGSIGYSSNSGYTWTSVIPNGIYPSDERYPSAVAYGLIDGSGVFVAVGYDDGDEGKTIGYSRDGAQTWNLATANSGGFDGQYGGYGVAYGYNRDGSGVFVAVGSGSKMCYSTDADTWTPTTTTDLFLDGNAYGVAFGYNRDGSGVFVAVGYDDDTANHNICYSFDGGQNCQIPTDTADLFVNGGYGIAYGYNRDGSGVFVSVGRNDNDESKKIGYSYDGGDTWQVASETNGLFNGGAGNGIAYNGNGLFVAVGSSLNDLSNIGYSMDGGDTWHVATGVSPLFSGGIGKAIAFAPPPPTTFNLIFGPGIPPNTNINSNILPTTSTTYQMKQSDLPTNCTLAIWNTFTDGTPVSVYLTDITPSYIYNVTINSFAGGLGGNVIIDGTSKTFIPGADIAILKDPIGNGFIRLNDHMNALTGIEVKNINFTINAGQDIYTADNSGWICAGGTTKANSVAFTACSVTSSSVFYISDDGYDNNGGICGGQNNAGSSYTFTTCTITSAGMLMINFSDNGGICGGQNGLGTFTFNQCSIIGKTGVTCNNDSYDVPSYNFISLVDNPTTTPPTIANNSLLFGDTQPGIYGVASLLIVSPSTETSFPPAPPTEPNTTYVGYNLTGTDLSGVNLSNYDLTGTILTGVNLTGVTFSETTKITDSVAIADNIVKNSGSQVINNVYTVPSEVLTQLGMGALNNGLTSSGGLTQGMSLFTSGLFTALSSNVVGLQPDTQVLIPAASLPSVNPWITFPAGSTVQLLNASINTGVNIDINTVIDLTTLNTTTTFFYVLVQNFPDTATLQNGAQLGANTLVITALAPYNPVLTDVSFSCVSTIGGISTTVIKQAGDPVPITFEGRSIYIGSGAWEETHASISNICFPAGTLIKTDQGTFPIEKLQSDRRHTINKYTINKYTINKYTINKKVIQHITKTITQDTYLICFEQNAIGPNVPSARTLMTKDHKILFSGNYIPAAQFLKLSNKIKKVKYTGEILYNVLLENYGTMNVNNLICETLHPDNVIAKLYNTQLDEDERNTLIVLLNNSIMRKDYPAYKKIVSRLL